MKRKLFFEFDGEVSDENIQAEIELCYMSDIEEEVDDDINHECDFEGEFSKLIDFEGHDSVNDFNGVLEVEYSVRDEGFTHAFGYQPCFVSDVTGISIVEFNVVCEYEQC